MNPQHPLTYTREQVAARTSDYVCGPCGRQFLRVEQLNEPRIVTAHQGTCGLCGRQASVTHIRIYNWGHIPATVTDR